MIGHSLLTYTYDGRSTNWGDDVIVPEFDEKTEKYWLYTNAVKLLDAEGETIYEEDLAPDTPSLVDSGANYISLPPRLYAYLTLSTDCGDGQEFYLQL